MLPGTTTVPNSGSSGSKLEKGTWYLAQVLHVHPLFQGGAGGEAGWNARLESMARLAQDGLACPARVSTNRANSLLSVLWNTASAPSAQQ